MKNSKTLKIAIAAQMIALGVILSALSFNIPVFGVPAIRVDLIIIPIIIGGVILGKWFGIGIGVMVDIISYFLFFQSFGPYHFGFTLNLAVVGLLAGLIFSNQGTLSNILQKYSKKISIIISSSVVILSFIYILFTSEMRFEGVNFSIGIIEKLSIVVVGLISIVISYIFYRLYLKKNSLSKKNDFYKYFIIILLSELFILIATPLWLYDLYKIPIYFSIVSRLIRFALLFTFKLLIVVIISNVIEAISTKKISNIKVDKIEN